MLKKALAFFYEKKANKNVLWKATKGPSVEKKKEGKMNGSADKVEQMK